MQQRSDYFALKFDGFITLPSSGSYKFYTTSDEGSRLYVNGNQVINNDGVHTSTEKSSVNVTLTGGVPIPISLTYFENTGTEELSVSYEKVGGGVSKQIIPATILGQEYVKLRLMHLRHLLRLLICR